jgi:hypothetical protein
MAKKTRGARMAKAKKLAGCTKGGKGKIANRPTGKKILKT